MQGIGPLGAGRTAEANLVRARRKVGEHIVPGDVSGCGEHRVAVEVGHRVTELVDKVNRHAGHAEFADVLHAVLVAVRPHDVSDSETDRLHTAVNRRIPQNSLGRRVVLVHGGVVVPAAETERAVRGVANWRGRYVEPACPADVPTAGVREGPRVHVRVDQRVGPSETLRPRGIGRAPRGRDADAIPAREQVVDEIVPVGIRRHRRHGVPVGVVRDRGTLVTIELHRSTRDRRLAGVLDPVLVDVEPHVVAHTDDGLCHSGIDARLDVLRFDARDGVEDLVSGGNVERQREGIGQRNRRVAGGHGIGIRRHIGTLQRRGPRHPIYEREAHPVGTGREIREQVSACHVGGLGFDGSPVEINGGVAGRTQQFDSHTLHTGLTGVLDSVRVRVVPDNVSNAERGGLDAAVDGGVPQRGLRQRVGFDHGSVVVRRTTACRVVRRLADSSCRHREVENVTAEDPVRVEQWVVSAKIPGPRRILLIPRGLEPEPVVAGKQVVDEVMASCVCRHRSNRVAVGVGRHAVAPRLEQLDLHSRDPRFARVLDTVFVDIEPHIVAHADNYNGLDAGIDRRVPQRGLRQRVRLDDGPVVVRRAVAARVVRRVADGSRRDVEPSGLADVPRVIERDALVVHVRVRKRIVPRHPQRPRRVVPLSGRELDAVLAGNEVVDEIVPVRIGGHRRHRVAIGIHRNIAETRVDQLRGHPSDPRLARVLQTVLVQVEPHIIAYPDNHRLGPDDSCIHSRVDELSIHVWVGVDHLARRRNVPRQREHIRLGNGWVTQGRRRVGVCCLVSTSKGCCPRHAVRQCEANLVVARREVPERIEPTGVCRRGTHRVSLGVERLIAIGINEIDGDAGKSVLTRVLDTIRVRVDPHPITHAEHGPLDASIDRGVPQRCLRQRVGLDHGPVVVRRAIAGRVVPRCADRRIGDPEPSGLADVPRVIERDALVVHVRVRKRIVPLHPERPRSISPPRSRELDAVLAGNEVVDEVAAVHIRRHRRDRVAIGIHRNIAGTRIDQLRGHPGDPRLARVLQTVLVQVEPHHVADSDNRRGRVRAGCTDHPGVEGRVHVLRPDVRVGVRHLACGTTVPIERECSRLGHQRVGKCRDCVRVRGRAATLERGGPEQSSGKREAHLVLARSEVGERVLTVAVRRSRPDWVPVLVVHGVAVGVQQLDGHVGNTEFAGVLNTVLVGVGPYVVAHSKAHAL